ncbi:ammonium transporter member [Salix suchowensis]|nr:ammonium transporter member [Salix suchowensis]
MGIQPGGILSVIFTNISTTSMVCWFAGLVVPLRFSDNELQVGDDAIHGEEASALWNDEETFQKTNSNSVFQAEDSSYSGKGASEEENGIRKPVTEILEKFAGQLEANPVCCDLDVGERQFDRME